MKIKEKKIKKKEKIVSVFPAMSWEKPIGEEILDYCNFMASHLRNAEAHHRETGWFSNNGYSEQCGAMALAYETVANHVRQEIKIRATL